MVVFASMRNKCNYFTITKHTLNNYDDDEWLLNNYTVSRGNLSYNSDYVIDESSDEYYGNTDAVQSYNPLQPLKSSKY